jgi:hypothetical protein
MLPLVLVALAEVNERSAPLDNASWLLLSTRIAPLVPEEPLPARTVIAPEAPSLAAPVLSDTEPDCPAELDPLPTATLPLLVLSALDTDTLPDDVNPSPDESEILPPDRDWLAPALATTSPPTLLTESPLDSMIDPTAFVDEPERIATLPLPLVADVPDDTLTTPL